MHALYGVITNSGMSVAMSSVLTLPVYSVLLILPVLREVVKDVGVEYVCVRAMRVRMV